MANSGAKPSSKNDGMYGMFVGIFDKSKLREDAIEKQKFRISKLLHTAIEFLRKGLYKDAKVTFAELKEYMKITDVSIKSNKKYNFKENIPFITLMCYSYSFLMMNEPRDENELLVVAKDIAMLLREAPKKHIIRFLELLFAFKKAKWAESLYLCDKLQNMTSDEAQESKYDWPHIVNHDIILELDKEYCQIQIENIQENSMFGQMEKMIKVEIPQYNNQQAQLLGLKWLKSRYPDLFKTVLKRLRQFKQPMDALALHKFIHLTVFPKLYPIISVDTMPFFLYYREDFLNSCEECMRAHIHTRAGQELVRSLRQASAGCQSEYEDDDDDYIDIDDDDDDFYEDSDVPPKRKKMVDPPASSKILANNKATNNLTCECNHQKLSVPVKTPINTAKGSNKKKPETKSKECQTVSTPDEHQKKTNEEKTKNKAIKPVMKEQGIQTNVVQEKNDTVSKTVAKVLTTEKVIQTDKVKLYHKFSQTITAVAKIKKNEKLKVNHKYCQTSDKIPFWSDNEVVAVKNFGVQVEILKWSETKTCSVQTETNVKNDLEKCGRCSKTEKMINDELKGLKSLITKKNAPTKDDTYMQVLQRLEDNQFSIMESLITERQDQFNRNTFLQKLLLDQIHQKYLIYKDIYSRLEKKCKFVINNVTELHSYLTRCSVPNLKQNNIYLNRWQKTLTEIQIQSKEIKLFYKTSKNKIMTSSNDFETEEWPKIAEIPMEALTYIFDNLKGNNKQQGELKFPKPIRLNNKTVKIVSPIEELKKCVSPVESIKSNQSLNKCDKFLEFTLANKEYEPIPMPPSRNIKSFELNESLNKCDEISESAFSNEEYQPISMPPSRNTKSVELNDSLNKCDKVSESALANEGYQPISMPPSRNTKSVELNDSKSVLADKDYQPISMSASTNVTLDSSDSVSSDADETLATDTPPSASVQDSQNLNTTLQLGPSSNEETTIFHSPLTILPPEFYRNFPPPPLPPNFKLKSISPDFQQESDYDTADEYQSQSNNKENIPENTITTKQYFADKNVFEPKFSKPIQNCFESFENEQFSVNKEEEDFNENEDVGELEPENESSESLDSYVENRRINKPKLKNVDENGREVQKQNKANDQEIFSFLRQQCSGVPEQDLIDAILTVMRNLGDAFEQLPKQDILKQVKIELPSKTPWKTTALLFPHWETDKADTDCSICFENLKNKPLHTLPCRHQFHKDCIKGWLQTNSVCPICRVHSVCDENFPPLK